MFQYGNDSDLYGKTIAMDSPVLQGLRSSHKGNLTYDCNWYDEGRICEIIEECTSPPSFSPKEINVIAVLHVNNSNSLQSDRPSRVDQTDSGGSFLGPFSSLVVESPHSNQTPAAKSTKFSDDYSLDSEAKDKDAEIQAYYKRTGEVEVTILDYEQKYDAIAKENVKQRQQDYNSHSKMLTDQAVQNTNLLTQQFDLKNQTIMQKIREVNEATEQNRQKRLRHQQERQRLHVKRMDAKMRAAQQEKEKAEEAERQRRADEMEAYLKSMMNVKQQIDEVAKRIVGMLDGCRHKSHLPEIANQIRKKVEALCRQADQQVQAASHEGASMHFVESLKQQIVQMLQCQELTAKAIGEADRLGQEEATRKAKEAEEAAKQKAVQQVEVVSSGGTTATTAGVAASKDKGSASLSKIGSDDALEEYKIVQHKLTEVIQAYQTLKSSADPQVKKFRNDVMKAVNTPINAVSAQSGRQLLDQLRRITKLLSGESVEITGGRRVSIAAIPSGKAYCQETLARKLVDQCDKTIASNHEAAFPFAAITVAVWKDYPEVKQLMLAHFYKGCPFLVPYYIPKLENQSTADYYKALGYVLDAGGKVEAQDKYLKRLSGFMRLYAAIIATKPLHGGGSIHPHGPSEGWKWLCRVMNLEPQPDVTATMLFQFLEVCGHTLANSYGKQFFKLIQALCRQYFTKIEAVTPKGSASCGPVLRLKNYLENCVKTQKISPPKGLLTDAFWRS